MIELSSLVLFATDANKTGAFYMALGVDLEPERHDDEGPVHLAASVGDTHFAVYEGENAGTRSLEWRTAGGDFPGFYVDSIDDTLAALSGLGSRLIREHEIRPWGCRVIVEDPDGRPIEIIERDHCPVDPES
ncbi:MAG: VOC family protein [Acidimicrobiales bacterium]